MMEEGGQADVRLVTVLAAGSLAVTAGFHAKLYRSRSGGTGHRAIRSVQA